MIKKLHFNIDHLYFWKLHEKRRWNISIEMKVLCRKILEVEKVLAKEDVLEKVKDQIVIADRITNSKKSCDINS